MMLLGRRKEKDAMKLENGVTFAFPILVFLWKGPQRHIDIQCVHQAPALQSSYPIDLIKYTSSSSPLGDTFCKVILCLCMQLTMHCWVHKCRECPEILPNVNPRRPWRRNRNKQPDNQDDNTRYYVLSAHGYMIIVGASFVNMALNDNNCTTRPWINISMS